MTASIGGALRFELFEQQQPTAQPNPATAHRPDDLAALKREAENLVARGLSFRDVAALMALTEQGVYQLLSSTIE